MGGDSAGGRKSRVTRKHVIIGVTCAVVVAMVITGVLLGVKFYLDSANELVTVSVPTAVYLFHLNSIRSDILDNLPFPYTRRSIKSDTM